MQNTLMLTNIISGKFFKKKIEYYPLYTKIHKKTLRILYSFGALKYLNDLSCSLK